MIKKVAGADTEFVLSYVLDLSEKFVLFNNICPYSEFHQKSAKILSDIRSFVINPAGADLLAFISELSAKVENDFYIFETLRGELYNDFSDLLSQDQENAIEVIKAMRIIFKTIKNEEINSIDDFFNVQIGSQHFLGLNSWKSLSVQEILKLGYSLVEVITNKSAPSLFKFSEWMLKKYAIEINELVLRLQANRHLLTQMTFALRDDDLQKELADFVTPRNLFKLIMLLQQNNNLTQDENISRLQDIITLAPSRNSMNLVSLQTCIVNLNNVLASDISFWNLLDKYPKECRDLEGPQTMASKIISWTIDIDVNFQKYFGIGLKMFGFGIW
jgi:hypothetical protein